jgi:hypothetical protein
MEAVPETPPHQQVDEPMVADSPKPPPQQDDVVEPNDEWETAFLLAKHSNNTL